MAESHVIARRFRPRNFEQVVGQEAITRTLANSIRSSRIHHAYLFSGARGVGKTTSARIFASALNCAAGPTVTPCGSCASCTEIATSSAIDVLEIDAASNTGVDNVRDVIINPISIAPARDRYKIFIIDEVHQLSAHAFNALLKTVEEPPPHVVFIMATTELHKVPETILSRCQVFEFRTISVNRIFKQLREIANELGVRISDSALFAIARAGDGSMRDAQSGLDQVISFAGEEVTDEDVSVALGLVDVDTLGSTFAAISEADSKRLLELVDAVVSRGYDLRNFCRDLMVHARGMLLVKAVGFDPELLQIPESERRTLTELAERFSEQDLLRFFSVLSKAEQDIRLSSHPRFQLEVALVKLAHAGRLHLLEDALTRLAEIEARLGSAQLRQPAKSERRTREVEESAPPVDEPAVDPPEPAGSPVDRVKAVLQSRNKMLLLSELEKAERCELDGDALRVSFRAEDASLKKSFNTRDKRTALEEVCREALGRNVRLIVESKPASPERVIESEAPDPASHPAVKAFVTKFHGAVESVTGNDSD